MLSVSQELELACKRFLMLDAAAKVGIPEFLNGIGNGVESHVAKLETEIGDFQRLLVTRTLKLKKLGIPCKHVSHTTPLLPFVVYKYSHLQKCLSICNIFHL